MKIPASNPIRRQPAHPSRGDREEFAYLHDDILLRIPAGHYSSARDPYVKSVAQMARQAFG